MAEAARKKDDGELGAEAGLAAEARRAEQAALQRRRLEEARRSGRVARITGLSLVAGGLVVGVASVFPLRKALAADDKLSEFNDSQSAPWTTDLDQAVEDADASTVFKMWAITGSAVIVGGIVYFIGAHVRSNALEEARVPLAGDLVPLVGPSWAGLAMQWQL
jgi:hypothetical protein